MTLDKCVSGDARCVSVDFFCFLQSCNHVLAAVPEEGLFKCPKLPFVRALFRIVLQQDMSAAE